MKVLFLIDSLVAAGKERQLIELLKGLKKRDDVQFCLVLLSDVIHYSYLNDLGIDTYSLKRRGKKDLSIYMKFYKLCKQINPDIIHSWESMCSIYAAPVARILGIKFINGMIRFAPSKLKTFGAGWIRSKLTFPFSDVILSNSHAGLKGYNSPGDRSYYIHNGFDFARIGGLLDSGIIRDAFEIKTPFVIGMIARFHARKDYRTYISSAACIVKKRDDVTFLAVGDGSTLNQCKKMIPQECLDRIKFLGRQDNIESIINIFTIGVLASYAEGISNSIMEYMALAKPVIATDDGGTREIVDHNVTGFLVEPENAEELTQKIEYLLDNQKVAREMGNAGKERLLIEFNLPKMVDRHVELYKKCIHNVYKQYNVTNDSKLDLIN